MSSKPLPKPVQVAAAVVIALASLATVYVVYLGDPLDMGRAGSLGDVSRQVGTLSVAMACAVVAHSRNRRWLRASAASGVAFFLLSLLDGYIYRGLWQYPLIVEWLVCALVGFAVASVVAVPFVILRRGTGPVEASPRLVPERAGQ